MPLGNLRHMERHNQTGFQRKWTKLQKDRNSSRQIFRENNLWKIPQRVFLSACLAVWTLRVAGTDSEFRIKNKTFLTFIFQSWPGIGVQPSWDFPELFSQVLQHSKQNWHMAQKADKKEIIFPVSWSQVVIKKSMRQKWTFFLTADWLICQERVGK